MKRPSEQPVIRLNKVIDMMRLPDPRLMVMHTGEGDHFYVVPGGRVDRNDAQKIIQRPDVHQFDDGLFPGNPQSWRIG